MWHAIRRVGGISTLVVRLKIADGWHTYARVPEGMPFLATKIAADLPKGFRWHGDWVMPAGRKSSEPGLTEYREEIVFVRQFYATRPAKVTLKGTVCDQACDAEKCWPPANKPFDTVVQVSGR
jgi:DsbC/DsbD-like thiol-disulfide interchange protein